VIDLSSVGEEYVISRLLDLTDDIRQLSPVEYSEENRYLPPSVTQFPGYIDFDLTPHLIEPLECMDVRSPIREGCFMKGHQIGASTILESTQFYFSAHIKTVPIMYVTADRELAASRLELNFIPMFSQSGMNIFQTGDEGNTRKTGKTRERLQWIGGGYMVPFGAKNADKMRQFSIAVLVMDEVGAWTDLKDGDPVELLKDRTSGFEGVNKILIVSTPTIEGSCKMFKQFIRGDQRVYKFRCLDCGYPQQMRWSGTNRETGKGYGFYWDYTSEGQLDESTVRYLCRNCGRPHLEDEKYKFITKESCFWDPTATAVGPNIRSWHAPSFISRIQPWYKHVYKWLSAVDAKSGRVKDTSAMQVFYNNVLGWPWRVEGGRVRFTSVSAHRRMFYRKGEIPNREIEQHCITGVLFLTMTVDVHKAHLNVAIWGWTAGDGFGFNPWLIDYFQILDDSEVGFESIDAPGWGELAEIIDNRSWKSDDGKEYRLIVSLIDSGYAESVVVDFCRQWAGGVWPIKGDNQTLTTKGIKSFSASKTKTGELLYVITVNHYKDRIAPVLRRTWRPDEGIQRPYTFNAPVDMTDDELKELTREYKIEKKFPNGRKVYEWHRPHGADNELWDLIVYGHASVEIIAQRICMEEYELDAVDWQRFWDYCRTGVFWVNAAV
jgi:phage terminase large subunit GpA-like protein